MSAGLDARISRPYPDPTPAGLRLVGDLLCAFSASPPSVSDFLRQELDQSRAGKERPVDRLILDFLGGLQPVIGALSPFGASVEERQLSDVTTDRALAAMAVEWAGSLSLLHADRHHWRQARMRGALVHLRRLVLEVALLRQLAAQPFLTWRRDRTDQRMGDLPGALEHFVQDLAGEIVKLTGG